MYACILSSAIINPKSYHSKGKFIQPLLRHQKVNMPKIKVSPRKKRRKGEKCATIFLSYTTYVRSSVTLLPHQFYGPIHRCVSIKRQETQMYSRYHHWSWPFLCFSTSLFSVSSYFFAKIRSPR